MGKLIKNHWARLIILTAAACMSPLQHPSTRQPLTFPPHRPNRRLTLRLLLAQTVLGLPNHEPRPRRPTRPNPPNHQPASRTPGPLLGMALTALHRRRHLHPLIQQPPAQPPPPTFQHHRTNLQPHLPKTHPAAPSPQTHRLQPPPPTPADPPDKSTGSDAPQHRSPPARLPAQHPCRAAAVPGHERGPVLRRRHGGVFLGFQRGGGRHGRAVDAAAAAQGARDVAGVMF